MVGAQYRTYVGVVGRPFTDQVKGALKVLYEDLASRIELISTQIRTPYYDNGERVVSSGSAIISAIPTPAIDVSYLMLLVEAWGSEFEECDWHFLVSSQIFHILHQLGKALGSNLGTASEVEIREDSAAKGGGVQMGYGNGRYDPLS